MGQECRGQGAGGRGEGGRKDMGGRRLRRANMLRGGGISNWDMTH